MKLLSALIVLPLVSLPALAGGLDRSQVDGQAKWIAHLDLEAFKSTQFFREIQAEDKEGAIEKGLAEFAAASGIQIFEDVYSVTAYGSTRDGDMGVVLVQASAHIEPALVKWQKELGAKPVTIGERACIEWGGGHGGGFSWVNGTGSDRRQIVLAKSAAALQLALDVLDHKRPALATDAAAELVLAPSAGTFAFVAANGVLDDLGLGGHGSPVGVSAAARLTKGIRLELGENAGSVFFDVRLRAEKNEDAIKLKKVFDGLLALPGLMQNETETSEIVDRLTQAITTETLGESMHMRFQYGAHALFDELRKIKSLAEEDRAPASDTKPAKQVERSHDKPHEKHAVVPPREEPR